MADPLPGWIATSHAGEIASRTGPLSATKTATFMPQAAHACPGFRKRSSARKEDRALPAKRITRTPDDDAGRRNRQGEPLRPLPALSRPNPDVAASNRQALRYPWRGRGKRHKSGTESARCQ